MGSSAPMRCVELFGRPCALPLIMMIGTVLVAGSRRRVRNALEAVHAGQGRCREDQVGHFVCGRSRSRFPHRTLPAWYWFCCSMPLDRRHDRRRIVDPARIQVPARALRRERLRRSGPSCSGTTPCRRRAGSPGFPLAGRLGLRFRHNDGRRTGGCRRELRRSRGFRRTGPRRLPGIRRVRPAVIRAAALSFGRISGARGCPRPAPACRDRRAIQLHASAAATAAGQQQAEQQRDHCHGPVRAQRQQDATSSRPAGGGRVAANLPRRGAWFSARATGCQAPNAGARRRPATAAGLEGWRGPARTTEPPIRTRRCGRVATSEARIARARAPSRCRR